MSTNSGFNERGPIETDPKKIMAQLMKEMVLEHKYDQMANKTVISVCLPAWLSRDYSDDTVNQFKRYIYMQASESISEICDAKPINNVSNTLL